MRKQTRRRGQAFLEVRRKGVDRKQDLKERWKCPLKNQQNEQTVQAQTMLASQSNSRLAADQSMRVRLEPELPVRGRLRMRLMIQAVGQNELAKLRRSEFFEPGSSIGESDSGIQVS